MSKKLIAIIITFVFIFGSFAFVNFIYLKDTKSQTILNKAVLPRSVQEVSISLVPNPLTVTSSQSATLNVTIDKKVTQSKNLLMQLELEFDPASIFNVNIVPGDLFLNPQTTLDNINFKTGRISYALKGQTNPSGTNIVATINFNTSGYSLLRQNQINFLPKTLVRIDDEEVKISSLSGATIVTKPALFQYLPVASSAATLNPKP